MSKLVHFNLSIILLMVVLAPTTTIAIGMPSDGSGPLNITSQARLLERLAHTDYNNGAYNQTISLFKKALQLDSNFKNSRLLTSKWCGVSLVSLPSIAKRMEN
jgi:hypothetical protein